MRIGKSDYHRHRQEPKGLVAGHGDGPGRTDFLAIIDIRLKKRSTKHTNQGWKNMIYYRWFSILVQIEIIGCHFFRRSRRTPSGHTLSSDVWPSRGRMKEFRAIPFSGELSSGESNLLVTVKLKILFFCSLPSDVKVFFCVRQKMKVSNCACLHNGICWDFLKIFKILLIQASGWHTSGDNLSWMFFLSFCE